MLWIAIFALRSVANQFTGILSMELRGFSKTDSVVLLNQKCVLEVDDPECG